MKKMKTLKEITASDCIEAAYYLRENQPKTDNVHVNLYQDYTVSLEYVSENGESVKLTMKLSGFSEGVNKLVCDKKEDGKTFIVWCSDNVLYKNGRCKLTDKQLARFIVQNVRHYAEELMEQGSYCYDMIDEQTDEPVVIVDCETVEELATRVNHCYVDCKDAIGNVRVAGTVHNIGTPYALFIKGERFTLYYRDRYNTLTGLRIDNDKIPILDYYTCLRMTPNGVMVRELQDAAVNVDGTGLCYNTYTVKRFIGDILDYHKPSVYDSKVKDIYSTINELKGDIRALRDIEERLPYVNNVPRTFTSLSRRYVNFDVTDNWQIKAILEALPAERSDVQHIKESLYTLEFNGKMNGERTLKIIYEAKDLGYIISIFIPWHIITEDLQAEFFKTLYTNVYHSETSARKTTDCHIPYITFVGERTVYVDHTSKSKSYNVIKGLLNGLTGMKFS